MWLVDTPTSIEFNFHLNEKPLGDRGEEGKKICLMQTMQICVIDASDIW